MNNNDKPYTVYVEKQSPEDKITFESLKMYHGECYGGIINRYCPEGNTLLSCSRCGDQANLYHVNQLRYFIRTAIDGKSVKFSLDGVLFEIHQKKQFDCSPDKKATPFFVEVKPNVTPLFFGIESIRMRHINCNDYGIIKITREKSMVTLKCKECQRVIELNQDSQINAIIRSSLESKPSRFSSNNNIVNVYPGIDSFFENW